MTGSAPCRWFAVALAAVLLGLLVPLATLGRSAHGATPATDLVLSASEGLGTDLVKPTGTCAGNSGGHGNGDNCQKSPTPTPAGGTSPSTNATQGGGSAAGASPGSCTVGGGTGSGGGAGVAASGGANPAGSAGPSGVGAGGTDGGTGARTRSGTGTAGGSAGTNTGSDDTLGLPTPKPQSAATIPGTQLPLWPILWTGTAVITLVTVAALLVVRDRRSRTDNAGDPDDAAIDPAGESTGTADDGQPAAQGVPSPRGPIKMDWTESPG